MGLAHGGLCGLSGLIPQAAVLPDVLTGIYMRYRASSLVLADGAAVTAWPDDSGNGYNAGPGAGSQASPLYGGAIFNGKPGVRFNSGYLSYMQSAFPNLAAGGNTVILAVMIDNFGPGAGASAIFFDSSNFSGGRQQCWAPTDGSVIGYSGAPIQSAAGKMALHTPCILFFELGLASGAVYLNNTVIATGNPGGAGMNSPLTIGADIHEPGLNLQLFGVIAEMRVYSRILTTLEKDTVYVKLKNDLNL